MRPPAPHPTPDLLAAYAAGRLPPRDAAAIEHHLADCPGCGDAADALAPDSFVFALRDAAGLSAEPVPTTPHAGADPTAAADPLPAELLDHPRYRLGGLLGRGGMGAVFRAEHTLMGRPVAVKVIAPGLLDHPGAADRFRHEVKAAARLQHPNIVTAHDAEQVGPVTVLVMEYVEGRTLADVLRDGGPLPAAEACGYARQAALGLAHAHGLGMVHRDVKPGNLMLTPDGRVKILDFGLARFVSDAAAGPAEPDTPPAVAAATAAGTLTGTGVCLGTLDYMAPEQAEDARAADPRADVYALGATLYHLLAGRPPFAGGGPVDKLYRLSFADPTPLAALRPDLPPGLARVVERMMAKVPARRLATAAEAAAALAPFAAPARRSRRRWLAAATVLFAAAVTAGLVAANYQPATVVDDPPPAAGAPELPAGVTLVREWKPADATVNPAVAFTPAGKVLVGYAGENGVREYDPKSGDETARFTAPAARFVHLLPAADGGRLVAAARTAGRGVVLWTWDRVKGGAGRPIHHPRLLGANLLALFPDGRHVTTSGLAGNAGAAAWSIDRGELVDDRAAGETLPPPTDLPVHVVVDRLATTTPAGSGSPWSACYPILRSAWQPLRTGEFLFATGPTGREVGIMDIRTGDAPAVAGVTRLTGHTGRVNAAVYHPTGRHLLTGAGGDGEEDDGTGGPDRTVRLWDAYTGAELLKWEGNPVGVYAIAAADDGRHVLVGGHDGAVRLYRLPELPAPTPAPPTPAPPPGDTAAGAPAGRVFPYADGAVRFPVFHPDGKHLLAPDGAVVSVWDLATGNRVRALTGLTDRAMLVRLTPDGKTAVGLSATKEITGWDWETGRKLPVSFAIPDCPEAMTLALLDGGKRIAAPAGNGFLTLRAWPGGEEVGRIDLGDRAELVFTLDTSPDGRYLAATGRRGRTVVYDVPAGRVVATLPPTPDGIFYATGAFSPDAKYLGVGSGVALRVWEVGRWAAPVTSVNVDASGLVGFDAAAKTVTTAPVQAAGGKARLVRWDRATGRPVAVADVPLAQLWNHSGLAPDGEAVAVDVQSRKGFVLVRPTPPTPAAPPAPVAPGARAMTDQPVGFVGVQPPLAFGMQAHGHAVTTLLWHPDGKRLVTCGEHNDRVARVWDVPAQKLLHTFGPHERGLTTAALHPNRNHLLTSDYDGDTRVWDLTTGAQVTRLAHGDWTTGLAVSSDGRRVLTAGVQETPGASRGGVVARLWDAATWTERKAFPPPADYREGPCFFSARAAFLSDRRAVTAGWKDGSLSVWDVDAASEAKRLTPPQPAEVVHALAVLPGGKQVLAGGQDGFVRLWDVDAGTVARSWKTDAVCDAVAADPTGRFLAAGARDGAVWVWHAVSGEPVVRWGISVHVSALAFRPDGLQLAAAARSGTVRAWNLSAPPAVGPRTNSD